MTQRILVVEDDVNINQALCLRLKVAGYEVCTALDGLAGLSAAEREKPDLLILDITMPGEDGLGVVQRMRKNPELENTPFIFLTASKRLEYRRAADELGASAFLEKPYDAATLLEAVQRALNPSCDA